MQQNAFDILQERGFIYQTTDADLLKKRLAEKPLTFYIGFDPTGNSLHIGHLLPVMAMRWMQQAGHRAIALVGGGTAMVGDPSGKTEARPILTAEDIDANAEGLKSQLARFLDFSSDDKALMLNNAAWLRDINYIEFLRDVGKHFSINRMLTAESVKMRLETGLSFLEFNYMLLQSYDFYILRRDYDCELQLGGQDQWGNIVSGVDLTRRMLSQEVHGGTFPLLLKSDGQKFGKTASGAVWLDENRTSPFEYYQFWRNVDDGDVARLMGFFTAIPMDEVKRLGSLEAPAINRAKEILAFEATKLAHGTAKAEEAFKASVQQFGLSDPDGKIQTSSAVKHITVDTKQDLPTVTLATDELEKGLTAIVLFKKAGLANTNSEARRLIQQGGAYVNEEQVTGIDVEYNRGNVSDGELILRAGKKRYKRVVFE